MLLQTARKIERRDLVHASSSTPNRLRTRRVRCADLVRNVLRLIERKARSDERVAVAHRLRRGCCRPRRCSRSGRGGGRCGRLRCAAQRCYRHLTSSHGGWRVKDGGCRRTRRRRISACHAAPFSSSHSSRLSAIALLPRAPPFLRLPLLLPPRRVIRENLPPQLHGTMRISDKGEALLKLAHRVRAAQRRDTERDVNHRGDTLARKRRRHSVAYTRDGSRCLFR